MPPVVTTATAVRFTTVVGVVTALAGSVLVAAPKAAGPLLSLTTPSGARMVGALDLALVPGLLAGRPRWPWLAARTVANIVTAAYCLRRASGSSEVRRARAVAATFVLLTLGDSTVAAVLRNAGR